jgi:hypothetical protein
MGGDRYWARKKRSICLKKRSAKYGYKEWLENDLDFVPLRDHPRFQALRQQLSVAPNE